MAKTLDDLTDEEYDLIMDARNRAAREAVVGTIIGRIPRNIVRTEHIRAWLGSWDYESLQQLVGIYNPRPTVRRDDEDDDVPRTTEGLNFATLATATTREIR